MSQNQKLPKTSQELKQVIFDYYKPIFNGFDKDRNGSLQKEELRLLLANAFLVQPEQISNEQVDYHFNKIDLDHNGHITYEEYFRHFFGEKAEKVRHLYFQKFDYDNSKLLDKQEFKALMKETFIALDVEITDEMVDWNFNKMDSDGDGKITIQQYLKLIKAYV